MRESTPCTTIPLPNSILVSFAMTVFDNSDPSLNL